MAMDNASKLTGPSINDYVKTIDPRRAGIPGVVIDRRNNEVLVEWMGAKASDVTREWCLLADIMYDN